MAEFHELVVNLHMHTTYSDGSGSHQDIVRAGFRAGLDAAIVTDHNVLVSGPEGYYKDGKKRLLLLIGEEIHDQARQPQQNHLLVLNANRELAAFASDPQNLIDNIRRAGGLSFIAHPYDPECAPIKESDISWVDWQVQGYTGLELWNMLSELKVRVKNYPQAVFYAIFPRFLPLQPPVQHLNKWDELHRSGKKVVAIGGSDTHALPVKAGPFRLLIYPYEFQFQTINTHLLIASPLTGEVATDKKMIYEAFTAGHCFVAYDLPSSTRGFRFSAQGRDKNALMGDELPAAGGVTLKVWLPQVAECRLLKDGQVIQTWKKTQSCTHITTEPGVYRVEVWRPYLGRLRGWIFSNPIYVR
jgi:hypothetical protein